MGLRPPTHYTALSSRAFLPPTLMLLEASGPKIEDDTQRYGHTGVTGGIVATHTQTAHGVKGDIQCLKHWSFSIQGNVVTFESLIV